MTTEKRNKIYEDKKHFVDITVRKHRIIIRSCSMELDDVRQELSLRLLELIGGYDKNKCPNLDAYLMLHLKYKIWSLSSGSKLTGMPEAPTRGFRIKSLDMISDICEPASYGGASGYMQLEQTVEDLPKKERLVLNQFIDGKRIHCTNKILQSARRLVLKQINTYQISPAS